MKIVTGFDDAITMDNSYDIENITSSKLIDINSYPVKNVIKILLQDKTTKKNIIWGTDSYVSNVERFKDKNQIKTDDFYTGIPIELKPRNKKDAQSQQKRTKSKAEVFTPTWICNLMNNHSDAEWFGHSNIFNTINDDNSWSANNQKITFNDNEWKKYIDSRRLEITCGEAPFIVSRYDASTGSIIYPLINRIGILDRKLRVINENTDSLEEWSKWVLRAFQSCYGFEWQGDNLLIARINLLMTFYDYYVDRWNDNPDDSFLKQIANTITWNFWQMDGLNDTVPFGKPYQEQRQLTLFDSFENPTENKNENQMSCKIYDWRRDNSIQFGKIKKVCKMGKLFDFVIGNPPYQETQDATSDTPVYNHFMDSAYEVSDCVELITPARFLFNAGKTPVAWNQKMLNDPHLKVLYYEQDSSKVFSNTDIKGGVAVTYRNAGKSYGAIGTFTTFEELNTILHKVVTEDHVSITDSIYLQTKFNLEALYHDFPDCREKIGSNGNEKRLTTSIFSLTEIFSLESTSLNDVKIVGLVNNRRETRWINSKYIENTKNLHSFKVILPKSNGSGAIGEVLSTPLIGEPLIGEPLIGYTQTFISVGNFETIDEAENAMKYIKSKFARVMLGTLKVTQDNNKPTWKNVPLQDFTYNSDIDWSKSIHEIDLQLYQKYGLTDEEINFIESHVQEMN